MKGTAVMLMVFSGLCFLPSCFPRLFIVVEKNKTWDEAQTYCRWKYTDLASVHKQQDLAELNQLIDEYHSVWIGLQPDTEAWRWSLENQSYYGEGETEFRKWAPDHPNDSKRWYKSCATVAGGVMWTPPCTAKFPFLCYRGTAGAKDSPSSYVFFTDHKTWDEAQSYCRTHYVDLASVRNQAEHDLVQVITIGKSTWIGLYRDSWKWSDGSKHSFSYWSPGAPSTIYTNSCVVSNFGKWSNQHCQTLLFFVCYSDVTVPTVRKQVVRVVLKKTDSTVDMEELKDGILEEVMKFKFNQKLKDHGLSEDVKLRWVTQPDGKVFHKVTSKKKEKNCNP